MLLQYITASTLLLLLVAADDQYCATYQPPSVADAEGCPSAHVIGIRGTTELPGPGAQSVLIDQILGNRSGSDACGLVYPATGILKQPPYVNFGLYKASEQAGVDALTNHLINYANTCPDTPIVLMGYSQGAHVIGDVLCGRTPPSLFKLPQPPIDKKYTNKIVAIIQFGDPSNSANPSPPWHVGTSTTGGIFPRNTYDNCTYLGSKWQSYCDVGDPFCAKGLDMSVHLSYLRVYGAAAVKFILDRISGSGAAFVVQKLKWIGEL